jgi:hypothetical protein
VQGTLNSLHPITSLICHLYLVQSIKNPFLIHLKTTTFPANISTFFLNSSATQLLGTWKNKY